MNKLKLRTIFTFSVAFMLGTALNAIPAMASTGVSDFGYSTHYDGTVTITSYKGDAENVEIPSTIDDNDVVEIYGDTFNDKDNLKSVEIPDTVKTIDNDAFNNCPKLQKVIIPESVTNIGEDIFDKCDNVTVFGEEDSRSEEKFANSTRVNFKFINNENKQTSRTETGANDFGYSTHYDGTITITSYKGNAENVEIPSSIDDMDVTEIYGDTFKDNDNLRSVKIPTTVKSISSDAFYNCSKLQKILIPSSVNSIGQHAVNNCNNVIIFGAQDSRADQTFSNSSIQFKDISEFNKVIDKNGWENTDGKWYYVKNGLKITGWESINGSWYLFDDSGVMQTNWVKKEGKWYYFNPSGTMQAGWFQNYKGEWYYFDSHGVMQTSTTIDGCNLNSDGVWVA